MESVFVMCFTLFVQNAWRRTAKSAVRHQTNVSNANVVTKRTRRDSAVSLFTLYDDSHYVINIIIHNGNSH